MGSFIFSLCCSGVLKMSRHSGRVTVRASMTCWESRTLWCWRWTSHLKPQAWSATESWASWNPRQRWWTSAEVRKMFDLLVKEQQKLTLSYLFWKCDLCFRSGCGSGCFGQSSAVWNDPCGGVRRDSPWTVTKVSPHSSTRLTVVIINRRKAFCCHILDLDQICKVLDITESVHDCITSLLLPNKSHISKQVQLFINHQQLFFFFFFFLCRDHPLLSLPNVLITPHLGTNTYATTRRMVQRMVENALAAVKGQAIPNEVKPKWTNFTDGTSSICSKKFPAARWQTFISVFCLSVCCLMELKTWWYIERTKASISTFLTSLVSR